MVKLLTVRPRVGGIRCHTKATRSHAFLSIVTASWLCCISMELVVLACGGLGAALLQGPHPTQQYLAILQLILDHHHERDHRECHPGITSRARRASDERSRRSRMVDQALHLRTARVPTLQPAAAADAHVLLAITAKRDCKCADAIACKRVCVHKPHNV